MKKLFIMFGICLCFIFFTSCNINIDDSLNNGSNTNDNTNKPSDEDINLSEEDIYKILESYNNKKKITINETLEGETVDGNKIKTIRITNINLEKNYFYTIIDNFAYIQKYNNNFYKVENQSCQKLNISSTNCFDLSGITKLFTYKKYNISNNAAKANFITPEVLDYKQLFDNVNIDLNKNYNYNSSSILKANILFENNDIKNISLDLSLVFGSYFTSLKKEITFSNDDFVENKFNSDLLYSANDSINISDKLDTYVIEMTYEYGDAIYIKSGDFDMLIDAGQSPDGRNVDKMLKEQCTDKKLDVLIATHGHGDHLGGFEGGALNSIEEIGVIIDFGYVDNGAYSYQQEKQKFIKKGAKYYSAYDCVNNINGASKIFKFSDKLKFEVLDTGQYAETNKTLTETEYDAENDFSVVIKLTFGENDYLYTGDLAGQINNVFTSKLKEEDIGNITVYKAAHHGATSHNSNNKEFINYINPKIAFSSSAIINQEIPYDHSINGVIKYQHPRPGFVRNILNTPTIKNTKQYYYNGTMGTIHFEDDGINLPTVTGLGPTVGYKINGNLVTGENNLVFSQTQMYKNYYLN